MSTHVSGPQTPGVRPVVLLADRDSLLRWSVLRYLRSVCDVHAVESGQALLDQLCAGAVDAVVISQEFPDQAFRRLMEFRSQDCPELKIIRLVTLPSGDRMDDVTDLEKPFALRRLAELLGVAVPASSSGLPSAPGAA